VTLPFFTIGHSNRSIEVFADLLADAEVRLVADVRTVPRSRANPQFDRDRLGDALAALGIAYEHLAALGGLRGRAAGVDPETNGLWLNTSFHNYADYALSAPFRAGLEHLIGLGAARACAVMCAEAVWWRCHRRIVADHLLARGETVFHIMAEGRVEPARLTPGAVARPDGAVVYPAARR
jgi:uncharacterized protein (DUF488 family)